MPLPLPSEIRVEALRDDVTYHLPVRRLGPLRWVGWLLIGFGCLFAAFPATSLLASWKGILAGRAEAGDWIFALFLLPFVAGGFVPFGLGVLILFGRCRVEWSQKRLSILDHASIVRWRRRLPKGRVLKFSVKSGGAKVDDKPVTSGPLADLAALFAEFEAGKPRLIALGYPRDWLQALAENLSARVGAMASALPPPAVELVDFNESEPAVAEVVNAVPKPATSLVRVEPRPNGFVLVIPPAGLRKGSKGLFGFGLIWCLFMTVFTAIAGFASGQNSDRTPLGAWVFIGFFWLIGLSMLACAINMGRRRAMLLVENGRLTVAQAGLFGAKRREWRREEVSAIRADSSGMEVNNKPLIELQVHPADRKKVGLFAGRDPEELRWMAAELRKALKLEARVQ